MDFTLKKNGPEEIYTCTHVLSFPADVIFEK